MEVTGKCFCGEVQFKARFDKKWFGICHCTDCQTFSGSAFRITAPARSEDFEFTSGTPTIFTKITERGTKRHMAFCPTCGTHVCALPDPESDIQSVSVRASLCDGFGEWKPVAEAFCSSRRAWLKPIEGAKQYETMPTPD